MKKNRSAVPPRCTSASTTVHASSATLTSVWEGEKVCGDMKYRILIIVAFLVCGTRAAYIEWGGVRHGGFCLIDDSYFAYGSGLVCKDMTGWDLFEATIGDSEFSMK